MYFSRRKVTFLSSGIFVTFWIIIISHQLVMELLTFISTNHDRHAESVKTLSRQYTIINNTNSSANHSNETSTSSDLLWKISVPDYDVIKLAAKLLDCGDAMRKAREHPLLARLGMSNRELTFLAEIATNCSKRLEKRHFGTSVKLCPCLSPDLVGPLVISKSTAMQQPMTDVSRGSFSPAHCHAHLRLALIIPYRNRTEHLPVFLSNIHQILQRQLAHYTVFVFEQMSPSVFNKAMLMNAGFMEVMKRDNFDCVIFHDIDLLPEDDRNIYTCQQEAVLHLGAYINKYKYQLLYNSLVGGAVAFTPSQFRLVNGFANKYFGWGGEDDDMYQRIVASGLAVWRYPENIAKYTMLTHGKDEGNPPGKRREEGLQSTPEEYTKDGLNSLKYKVLAVDENQMFIHYHIHLPDPPDEK